MGLVFAVILAVWGIAQVVGEAAKPRAAELPRGGTKLFPDHRLVGYSGYPGSPALGRLGTGDIDDRMTEIERVGADFARGRKLMPVMELIAVTVHSEPGSDGMYRSRVKDDIIESWLATARRHKAVLLLNIQPGRSSFIDAVKHLEKWLVQPDVGLALDPEWSVGPEEVPGKVYGHTSGPVLNQVAQYVAGLVAENNLPEKVVLYHQLHADIVSDEAKLEEHDGVVLVKSIDGIGSPAAKVNTWKKIVAQTPKHIHLGFKLFYDEDARHGPLMSADQVMELQPEPVHVLYE